MREFDYRALGPLLKQVREQMGLGLREVTRRSGVDQGYFCRIEKGNVPASPEVLLRLAEVYFPTIQIREKLERVWWELVTNLYEQCLPRKQRIIVTIDLRTREWHFVYIPGISDSMENQISANRELDKGKDVVVVGRRPFQKLIEYNGKTLRGMVYQRT